MNKISLIVLIGISISFLNSCGKIRESAGVNRKSIDEYTVIKNPPLALPPDYNLLPSEEIIATKKIQDNKELAKEILVGLDEDINENENNSDSSALDSILSQSGAKDSSDKIREEIDFMYANMSSTKGVFSGEKYMSDEEILDAVEESKRLRDNAFNNESILEGDIPITTRPKKRENILKRLF